MTAKERDRIEAAFVQLSGAFVRALSEAAVENGLDRQMSERITRQMVLGAVELLDVTGKSAADLMREVASKGGTTEAGLRVMDAASGVDSIASSALRHALRGE